MKKFIVFVIALISINVSAQMTKTREVYKGLYNYKITDRTEDGERIRYWSYTFQNIKYTHITDMGGFFFYDKPSLKQFADDILLIAAEPKGSNVNLKRERYSLDRHDFSPNNVFFTDEDGKYRKMTVKQAQKFANHILQNAVSIMPEEGPF